MYQRKSSLSALLSVLALCILLAGLLSGCAGSGNGAQNSGTSGDPGVTPAGTGDIAFQIAFQSSSGSKSKTLASPSFNACVDYGIDTISATVSNGTTTVTTKSWPCSLHQGSITGVPAASNYTLKVDGKSSGATLWSGSTSSITVNAGQQTNAGTITLTYKGTDTTPPTVTVGPNSNFASTTNIPITDRLKVVFSEAMEPSTITSTNITLNSGSVPGTVGYDSATKTATFIPSSNLAYSTSYTLQVLTGVKDLAGNSPTSSSSLTFTTESTPIAAPNAPTGLTAVAGNGQVRLDWPAVNGADSYNVYYSTSSLVSVGTGTPLASVKAPSLHLGLADGTTYYYIVTAVSPASLGNIESSASASTSATPAVTVTNPAAPTNLAVTYNSGTGGPNTVTWTAVAGLSYNLYRSTRGIYPDHTQADNVYRYVNPGSYTDSSVSATVTYCYIVTAVSSAGESADSNQVCGPGTGGIQLTW